MHPPTPRRSWFLLLPCAVACSSAATSAAEDPGGSGGLTAITPSDGGETTTSSIVEAGADTGAKANANAMADAAALDAGVDAASACLSDEAGDAVCPATGPCADLCRSVVASYRSGIAHAAAACIGALATCRGATDVIPCVDQATARACPTDDALAYCQGFVSRCDPNADDPALAAAISTVGCVAIASGLGPGGRAAFQACIETAIQAGTCATDVVACADSIRQ